jgi:hypothetical protein
MELDRYSEISFNQGILTMAAGNERLRVRDDDSPYDNHNH